MPTVRLLPLYLLALALATPAAAGPDALRDAAAALPQLEVVAAPAPAPDAVFAGADGAPMDLSAYAGKPAVVNFWATWCAPCRAEMPGLQRLADTRDDLEVVTIAFGRHNPAAMARFWEEAGITSLPLHLDADGALARALGVRGLPHTVILDAEGRLVASYRGEAVWDGPEVGAVLDALVAP